MMEGAPETLVAEGYQARRDDRLEDAKSSFAAAIDLCRPTGNTALLARALAGLGQIERDIGNLNEALRLYREAVDLYRTLDEPLRLAHTIRHEGDILRHQEQLVHAQSCYKEALAIYRGHKDTLGLDLANTLRGFALARAFLLKVYSYEWRYSAHMLWRDLIRMICGASCLRPSTKAKEACLSWPAVSA